MKKIIMILTNGFEPDVRVYKEAKYLVENGCLVDVLCWDRDCNPKLPKKETIDGISIVRFKIKSVYGTGWKQLGAYLRFFRVCSNYIRNSNFDYLHCHDIDGALLGFLSKRKKDKMLFDMHEIYENGNYISRFIWRHLTIFLIKASIAALYVTDYYLNSSYSIVHNKLYQLRNLPDENIIRCLPKTQSSVFRIGYHGVVREQIKEFKSLFEAVKGMTNVRVDINGGGIDLQKLQQISKKYSNVYINGPYDGINESSKLYSETDILFCAYDSNDLRYKSKGSIVTKFYEAVMTGTPILVTKGLGMESDVVNNGFGISCDTRNSDEIRNAINYFMDKDTWLRISHNEIINRHKYLWTEEVGVLKRVYCL